MPFYQPNQQQSYFIIILFKLSPLSISSLLSLHNNKTEPMLSYRAMLQTSIHGHYQVDTHKICHTSGTETFLQTAQLRWCGHVIRMDDTCIRSSRFMDSYFVAPGVRGRQYKRYKDCLKDTLK